MILKISEQIYTIDDIEEIERYTYVDKEFPKSLIDELCRRLHHEFDQNDIEEHRLKYIGVLDIICDTSGDFWFTFLTPDELKKRVNEILLDFYQKI